jgi:hypothetical protein
MTLNDTLAALFDVTAVADLPVVGSVLIDTEFPYDGSAYRVRIQLGREQPPVASLHRMATALGLQAPSLSVSPDGQRSWLEVAAVVQGVPVTVYDAVGADVARALAGVWLDGASFTVSPERFAELALAEMMHQDLAAIEAHAEAEAVQRPAAATCPDDTDCTQECGEQCGRLIAEECGGNTAAVTETPADTHPVHTQS